MKTCHRSSTLLSFALNISFSPVDLDECRGAGSGLMSGSGKHWDWKDVTRQWNAAKRVLHVALSGMGVLSDDEGHETQVETACWLRGDNSQTTGKELFNVLAVAHQVSPNEVYIISLEARRTVFSTLFHLQGESMESSKKLQ